MTSRLDPSFDRRFKWFSALIALWGVFVAVAALTIFAGVIYTLINPELIGQYVGRVADGFEGQV